MHGHLSKGLRKLLKQFEEQYATTIFNRGFGYHILITVNFELQRDTFQAASEFASRNKLPRHVEEQMLSHICLKFKTEELKQQETIEGLPKAIRSSIAECLFYPIVEKVYLFQGASFNLIFQLVRPIILSDQF